jgi:hypothetical protein
MSQEQRTERITKKHQPPTARGEIHSATAFHAGGAMASPSSTKSSIQIAPAASMPLKVQRNAKVGVQTDSNAVAQNVSQQSPLRERDGLRTGDDEMVERLDLYERERLLERLCEKLVSAGRFGHARGIIVRENHAGDVIAQCRLHQLPRMRLGKRELDQQSAAATRHRPLQVDTAGNASSVRWMAVGSLLKATALTSNASSDTDI